MFKVLFCILVLINSFYSFAVDSDFNATLDLLQKEFAVSTKPEQKLFNGSYNCKFHNADAKKVEHVEISIISHGEWFIFKVNDDRDIPHTEIITDNGLDYVSSYSIWESIMNRSFRINENGSLLVEISTKKTSGLLVRPITHYNNEDLFVVYYGLCKRL